MKKTLLLFLSFLATIAIQAQTFELTWDGETLGETVVINAEPSVGEVIFDPLVTNLTSSDINVKVRRTNVSVVEGSENYFCWVACYAPFVDESTEFFNMVAGSTTDQDFFSAHYTPLGRTGVTTVEYLFFNMDNEDQNLKVTVEYTIQAVAVSPFELTLDGELLPDAYEVTDDPTVGEMIFNPLVTNTTATTIKVKVRRTNITVVEGTENYFCWVACYAPFVDESSEYFEMAPGETTEPDFFSAHYTPLNIEGTTTVEYTFYNMDDETESYTITVNYKAEPNSISESVANGVQFDNIFPNPASNYVNINYTLVPEVYKGNVRITNLLGAVVSETPIDLNSNSMKIDVSNLDGGIYFYSVVLNGEILHSKKLIIK
jgi:YHS domain-containing protein